MDFGILSSIKIDFSQVKIIFIEIGCEIYSRFKMPKGFFGIAAKKQKVGHDNKLLRNYVGQHLERRGQFYYPLDRSFKSVAVAQ